MKMIEKTGSRFSLNKRWLLLFGLWLPFLSGALPSSLASPGVLQAVRLNALLQSKKAHLGEVTKEISLLRTEAVLLEKSKNAQKREIRRVLGYAAGDEIVFEFSPSDPF